MTTANLSEKELPAPPVEKELPVPQYHDTDSKPLIILLIVVLIIALLGMAGLFLWTKQASLSNDIKVVKNFTISTPTPTPNSLTNTEATNSANWKTYTNTKYDFSFEYPSVFTTDISRDYSVKLYDNKYASDVEAKSWIGIGFGDGSLPSDSSATNYKIGGTSWLKIASPSNDRPFTMVGINRKTFYVSVFLQGNTNVEINNYIDQILSTFKFTN